MMEESSEGACVRVEQWDGVFSITNETPSAYGEVEMFSYIHDGTDVAIGALRSYIESKNQIWKDVGAFRSDQYPDELPFDDEVRAYRVGFGATDTDIRPQPIRLDGFLQVERSEAA